MSDDFPTRPKPWDWEFDNDGETYFYRIFDANIDPFFVILDSRAVRERDIKHIVECVNEHEKLKARVQELEQQHPQQPVSPRGMEKEWQRKTELEQQIVRFAVYHFEFRHLAEQIDEIDRYEDFLDAKGQSLSFQDDVQRNFLSQHSRRLGKELKQEFPTLDDPASIQAELSRCCQELIEINTRLKQQPQDGELGAPERTPSYEDLFKQPFERESEQDEHER